MKITTEGPKFEIPSHYMKEVVASVKTEGQSQPVKTKKIDEAKEEARAQDGTEVGTQNCNTRKER
jgi:hypothetical protein